MIARFAAKYRDRGLAVVAPTATTGTGKDDGRGVARRRARPDRRGPARRTGGGFEAIPVLIDEAAMVRYGASATPTLALVDKKGPSGPTLPPVCRRWSSSDGSKP
ncbi:MAG: hypothetical protein R2862_08720 [Thermoanaerobaculia bacterium]